MKENNKTGEIKTAGVTAECRGVTSALSEAEEDERRHWELCQLWFCLVEAPDESRRFLTKHQVWHA